jgi:hypothetical protein
MRIKVNSRLFGLSAFVIYSCLLILACGHPIPENKYLDDSHISKNAKDYYLDRFAAIDGEKTLSVVDNLNTKNDSTRYFYFLLISKMQVTADGAPSEALENSCKDFLEHHPNDLITFLYLKSDPVDSVRITSWAKSIAGEFSIDCENSEMNCVDLSRMEVERNHRIVEKRRLDEFYEVISKFYNKFSGADSLSTNLDEKRKILEQFSQWKIKQYNSGRFVTDKNCNPDSALESEDSGLYMGIPNDIKINYSDINQDGKLDGLFLFNPDQCDGGNALMFAQTRVLVLSNGNSYMIDDTLIEYVEKHLKKGWLFMKRPAGGTLYGKYIEYLKDDGRCCPSIQREISINFKTGKLNFIKEEK